jgi:hypothetical protein
MRRPHKVISLDGSFVRLISLVPPGIFQFDMGLQIVGD